jgi:hypothetical protein
VDLHRARSASELSRLTNCRGAGLGRPGDHDSDGDCCLGGLVPRLALYMWRNRSRDLRLTFFAALVSGVAVGGWLRQLVGAPGTLAVSAVIKALVHILMLVASVDCDDVDGEVIPM